MTAPTRREGREFAEWNDALAEFVRAAADCPRLLPAEDGAGCPLFNALAALQWTGETGLVRPEDRLHAVWFHGESAATVVERSEGEKTVYRFLGPRLETRQRTPSDGRKVVDEPFVRGYDFDERWSAMAHFFSTTHGKGSLVSLLSPGGPPVEQVRGWLLELFQGPLPTGADHLHGIWLGETAAGFLFPPAVYADGRQRGWSYVELTRTGTPDQNR